MLSIGAQLDAIDTAYSGQTPLMEAARAGNSHICTMLLRAGADLLSKDAQGCTALHWAARRGRGALVLSMLRTADELNPGIIREALSVKNDKGKKPIDVSRNTSTGNLLMARMRDWKLLRNEKLHGKLENVRKRMKVGTILGAKGGRSGLMAKLKAQQTVDTAESKEGQAAMKIIRGPRKILHTPSMAAFKLDASIKLPPIGSAAQKKKEGPAMPWDM